jgi:tetratricopeptide (TPR) repeat protein
MFFEDNSWRDHAVLKEYASADLYVIMRKNAEAENTLKNLYDNLDDHDLKDDILFKLALIRKELENYDSAVQTFEKLVSEYPGSIYIEKALYETGMLFEDTLGNSGKAVEIYESFLINHPESIYLDEVRKRLRKLRSMNIG